MVLILSAISIPTYYLAIDKYIERQEIKRQEEFIEEVKRESAAMCEKFLVKIESYRDTDGNIDPLEYSKLLNQFIIEWKQYQDEQLNNPAGSDMKEKITIEMALIYNEYDERMSMIESSKDDRR